MCKVCSKISSRCLTKNERKCHVVLRINWRKKRKIWLLKECFPGNICTNKKWGYNYLRNFTSRELAKLIVNPNVILENINRMINYGLYLKARLNFFTLALKNELEFSAFGKTDFWDGDSLQKCEWKSPHIQRELQLLRPAVPLSSIERSPRILHQLVPTSSHLCIRMTCLTDHY